MEVLNHTTMLKPYFDTLTETASLSSCFLAQYGVEDH